MLTQVMLLNILTPLLALAAPSSANTWARSEDHIKAAVTLGGPHGKGFDDIAIVKDGHRRLHKITLSPCTQELRMSYIKFEYAVTTSKDAQPDRFSEHGTLDKDLKANTLVLSDGEYIAHYTGYPSKVAAGLQWKTRLSGLEFKTNLGNEIKCGGPDPAKRPITVNADSGKAFLYFSGASGDYIDNITGQAIPVEDYF